MVTDGEMKRSVVGCWLLAVSVCCKMADGAVRTVKAEITAIIIDISGSLLQIGMYAPMRAVVAAAVLAWRQRTSAVVAVRAPMAGSTPNIISRLKTATAWAVMED